MKVFQENGRTNGLAEATQRSYRALVDGAFAAQEQYAKVALSWIYGPGGAFMNPAETNRRMVEQSQKQWEALQTLVEESIKAYVDLFYAPNSSYSRDRSASDKNPGLPIADYDRLSVKEVSRKLDDLSVDEVKELKAYEKNNKNRVTLIEQFDRSLV